MEKLEWLVYQVVKQSDNMLTQFDRIHERDGQMDGHRMTAYAALMHSIARKKNAEKYYVANVDKRWRWCGALYCLLLSVAWRAVQSVVSATRQVPVRRCCRRASVAVASVLYIVRVLNAGSAQPTWTRARSVAFDTAQCARNAVSERFASNRV